MVILFLIFIILYELVFNTYRLNTFFERLIFHFGLFLFNSALCSLIFGQLRTHLFRVTADNGWGILNKISTLPLAKTFLSLLFLDFCCYWIHRFNHGSAMWRVHKVHHADAEVDVTTGLREHPLHMLSTISLKLLVSAFFGITFTDFVTYSSLNLIVGLIHHCEFLTFGKLQPLIGSVFVTPSFHFIHHQQPKNLADCNFGAVFSFWDRLFKTVVHPANQVSSWKPKSVSFTGVLGLVLSLFTLSGCHSREKTKFSAEFIKEAEYGRELIEHTARLLGPKGTVASVTGTRMNCSNCHLNGGDKEFGISFRNSFTRYPEYQARTGKIVTLVDRINNCFERPMNGRPLEPNSREMRALLAFYRRLSIGKTVGEQSWGDSLNSLVRFPDRAADPKKGALIYSTKCASCHGINGEGKLSVDQIEFVYPPVWGAESYNEASNMHRNIKLATFIVANMPLGATASLPQISFEDAFDVASFINDETIHNRPKTKWKDYEKTSEKPIDYPYGPYDDPFSEVDHRLGPYPQIIKFLEKQKKLIFY